VSGRSPLQLFVVPVVGRVDRPRARREVHMKSIEGKLVDLAKPVGDIADVVAALSKLIRLEPTCIKCGCTELSPCEGGCAWSFLNPKTNEGLCSTCLETLSKQAGRVPLNGRRRRKR
jgi:hypothetical protein